jgi:short-subunit dehydrogenase
VKAQSLRGRVVVLVGASSGIGRASALAFADHGCRLCLVARGADALEAVARECRARGASVVVVTADTADAAAVTRVGDVARETYGVVDVWVHAAAGLVAGPFGEEPLEEVRRLVDVDILGYVHGARTALTIFREQGHGTLVNVASVLGVVPNPVVPLYVMCKFGIVGLTRALAALTAGERDIHVGLVLPGPVDTTLFQHAANHTGGTLRAVPPACSPERAAAAVVSCARRPRRGVPVGVVARVVLLGCRVVPTVTDTAVAAFSGRLLVRRSEHTPPTAGALFAAPHDGRVVGTWRRVRARRALGDALGRALSRRGAVAVGTGAGTAEGPE